MNNGFGNFNLPTGGYYGGMMYQAQPQSLSMTQGLTKEQLDSLKKTSAFTLDISDEDLLRSYCTHRYENKFAVYTDEEGYFVCSLCGAKFKPFEGSVAEAEELVNKTFDLLETTKMQAIKLPPQTIRDFFQIQPLLAKLPKLYEKATNDIKNSFNTGDAYVYGQENNAFAYYQNMMNPMAGNGYHDPAMMNMQPMYGAQPYYNQQPQMMNPGMPMQQPMYNNGYQPQPQMMYNNGQMPQQANPFNTNGAPVNMQPAPQAQQPAAPAQPEQVSVTKTLTD